MLLSMELNHSAIGVVTGILAIVALLFISALVSGSEIAFFSLSPSQIHELKNSDSKHKQAIMSLLGAPKRLLATLLISNNFVNVAIVVISTYITNTFFELSSLPYWITFLIQVVVVTAVILFFGEILPKVYATQKNVQFAHFMVTPLKFMVRFFHPISSLLMYSTNIIDRRISRKSYNISMSELSDAIELTSDHTTPEEEKKILQGIVRFGDIEVKEIMRSRLDVAAIEFSTGYKQLLDYITESGYSRIPVYKETFDNVKGVLYIKDLLPFIGRDDGFDWQKLLRDAFFVPEKKKINDLLEEFQEKKIHLAVVVDEYGGTSGIITLEDIIEEIVGEISDEHDEPLDEVVYTRVAENNYIFEGKTSINDFCKVTGIEDDVFDGVKGDADSLAGVVLELMKKMPEKDESVEYRNFKFTVRAVDKRRIKRIQVEIGEPQQNKEEE
jgi:gliding motility-associated protein GldE